MMIHLLYPIRYIKIKNTIKYYIALDTGLKLFEYDTPWDIQFEILGFGIQFRS